MPICEVPVKIFLAFLLFSFSLLQSFQYDLSVCAIFQDEAPYLKEWIDHHKRMGVQHFYLYNNNSKDDYLEVLMPFVYEGSIEIIQWPSHKEINDWKHYTFEVQTGAYNDALNRSKNVSKWLALIDVDEYVFGVKERNVLKVLETHYPNVSGLCVNWQCYGTSHTCIKPGEKMLEKLVMKMKWDHPWNKHSKSIVQPLHVDHCPNPHYCVYKPGYFAIDSDGDRTDICCQEVNIDVIRINHYWTKDEWFFWNIKIPRYIQWGSSPEAAIKHAEEMNKEYDPILSYPSR